MTLHGALWRYIFIPPFIKGSGYSYTIGREYRREQNQENHVIASPLSSHCDVISNRLWRHHQNDNRAGETRGRCVKIVDVCTLVTTGLTHAKLVSLTSPCCSGWPAPMNTPQGQQRTAEQRWVRWFQCLFRKWSCVNHQFQFHTQVAYKVTYTTHDLCYLLLFNYWLWHKI